MSLFQAPRLVSTMNLVRRLGPSMMLHPSLMGRWHGPRGPQPSLGAPAEGWEYYGENKVVQHLAFEMIKIDEW